MDAKEIVKALREHAEWAQANEWECPITLGDDLRKAADTIEELNDFQGSQCAKLLAQLSELRAENARLRAMVEADRDGRCAVLPCKTGDTIYQLRGKRHARGEGVSPRIISCAQVWSDGDYELLHQGATPCTRRDFGKTWFLTRAEAEAALAGKDQP